MLDDIAVQGETRAPAVASGTVAYLDENPAYKVLCDPQFQNPVPVHGLSDKIIGFANLTLVDGRSNRRELRAEVYLNYGTEERLHLEAGNNLWADIRVENIEIGQKSISFDRAIEVKYLHIQELKLSQRPPSFGARRPLGLNQ